MIRGSCLRGEVTFAVSGETKSLGNRRCPEPRRAHGAAFGTVAATTKVGFAMVAAEQLDATNTIEHRPIEKKETLGTGQRPSSGYDIRVPRDGGVGNLRPFAAPSVIRRNGSALLGRHHLTRRSATLVHSYLPKSAWNSGASTPKLLPDPGLRWSP